MHSILLDSYNKLMVVDWPFRNRAQGIVVKRLKSSDSQVARVNRNLLDSIHGSATLPLSFYTRYCFSQNHLEVLVPNLYLAQVWQGNHGLYDISRWSKACKFRFLHISCISISLHISDVFYSMNIWNLYRFGAILQLLSLQHQQLHHQLAIRQPYGWSPISHFTSSTLWTFCCFHSGYQVPEVPN